MTPYPDEHLTPEDRSFVDRLASHFSPSPLSPNQRATFDLELQERLEKRRRKRVFLPALATAAAAAAIMVLTLTGRFGPAPTGSPTPGHKQTTTSLPPESADEGTIDQWTYDLLAFNEPLMFPQGSAESTEFDETDDNGQAELLPDEYLAIEHIFLES